MRVPGRDPHSAFAGQGAWWRQSPLGIGLATVFLLEGVILFAYGLSLPIEYRVRGDAWEYMQLASKYPRPLELLAAVGPRSAGMPLVCLAARLVLEAFGAEPRPEAWANAVAAILFGVHFLGSGSVTALALRAGVVRSPGGRLVLFGLAAGFPALVAHTTVPLTDTLNADVVIFALHATERARAAGSLRASIGFGGCAGILWAFAVLLRPGNGLPVALALPLGLAFAAWREPRARAGSAATVVVAALALAPIVHRCHAAFGEPCVQAPETFEPLAHLRQGLRGARVLWFHAGYTDDGPPIVPDRFLVEHFADRCPLREIVGTGETSLLGCFARQPHLLPAFAFRKWVGLFDHFRFQPYAERLTPTWYRALSRVHDGLAWPGFFLALIAFARSVRRLSATAVAGLVYFAALVALHTIIHVEERYGLAWMPLACAGFVYGCEAALAATRDRRVVQALALVLAFVAADAWFYATVWSWDATVF